MGVEQIAPGAGYAAVTKSDATDLGPVRALYVGGAGNLTLSTGLTGAGVEIVGVLAGTLLPLACRRVMAATTATSIVAIY